MKPRGQIDYHGSRSYGSEEPAVGTFSLALAWAGEIIKSKLRRLRGPSAPPAVLLHEGKHSFTLLGAKTPVRAADCPFPTKSEGVDRRNWRVLP
jgi:hypothetical protein